MLDKIGNQRPIHKIHRSPNQNPNYKTIFGIKPINNYKGSVVIFDDMLELETVLKKMNFLLEECMKI